MALPAVRVLQTVEHRCGYYADRSARNLVVDPGAEGFEQIYDAIALAGFRRAGNMIFRPHCKQCQACLATRIPVERFRMSRSQLRCSRRNEDLTIQACSPGYTDERFELYRRYLAARHPQGGMDDPTEDEFMAFLASDWARTRFIEFRESSRLLAVSVVDVLGNGLSAVYTFFDPREGRRSLGTMAILHLIRQARREGLDYVFLGYWLKGHPKMDYKVAFRPVEIFHRGRWRVHVKDASAPSRSDPDAPAPHKRADAQWGAGPKHLIQRPEPD